MAHKIAILALFAGFLLVASGCKGDASTQAKTEHRELAEIDDMIKLFVKRNSQPPKQLSDLTTKEFEMSSPAGYRALKDGKYVVVYGVSAQDGGTLLAYAKEVPTKGGPVLMADGTMKTMTVDDFNASKK